MKKTVFLFELCPTCAELLQQLVLVDRYIKSMFTAEQISEKINQEVTLVVNHGPSPTMELSEIQVDGNISTKHDFKTWAFARLHYAKH